MCGTHWFAAEKSDAVVMDGHARVAASKFTLKTGATAPHDAIPMNAVADGGDYISVALPRHASPASTDHAGDAEERPIALVPRRLAEAQQFALRHGIAAPCLLTRWTIEGRKVQKRLIGDPKTTPGLAQRLDEARERGLEVTSDRLTCPSYG